MSRSPGSRSPAEAAAPGFVAVPTLPECLALMEEFGMLPHIREHSFMVLAVARLLGRELTRAGFALHLPLIEAGALLHDLGKTPCLATGENHAHWGAAVLEDRGYPEVARIVREHIRVEAGCPDPRPLREAEIVNYADKRVLHTQVVSLAQRFADLKRRYGKTPESLARIQATEDLSRRLEAKIFDSLSLAPEDLSHLNQRRKLWQSSGSP